MRSTFKGFGIANSGLFVAQQQLDVTSHNIANANTDGYSRQRFITSAVAPPVLAMQFSPLSRATTGEGAATLSLDQIRDRFLDQQYRTENSQAAYWNNRADTLYYVEDIFNSIDANSIDGIMSQFFNSLQELSKNPTDEAIRTNVTSTAKKLCDSFHMYYTQLTDLMSQQNTNLVEQAKYTNTILENIATLNDEIMRFELAGNIANDLRDQRNLLLDKLSSMMDISYTENSYDPPVYNIYGIEVSQLVVYAGKGIGDEYEDNILINDKEAFLLEYEEETGLNEYADNADPPIPTHIIRLASGVEFSPDEIVGLEGGILKCYMDLRDGDTTDKQGIPYFISQLDILANALVSEVNNVHADGYTMPYTNVNGSSGSVTGINFFDPDGISAKTIGLDEAILLSSFNIAASLEYVTMDSDGHYQTGNNLNILALIANIKERTDIDDVGSFEGYYKNFLGNLASEVSLANNNSSAQDVLVSSISTQRTSIMGVSLDEEMTDLIRFQHAYNAAARCITTMDEALDKLINGTGRVGL